MKTIEQLQARLADIRDEAQAIVDAADANESNPGQFTDDQSEKFDGLMSDKERVEADIKRREKLDNFETPNGRQTKPAKPASANVETRERVEDDPMRGFESSADFATAVKGASLPGGEFDQRLRVLGAPTNFHRETGSSDGYMVPPAVRDQVWGLVFQDEGILSAVSPEPTESNQVQLNVDESTPWSSDGVQAKWASEGQQFDPSRLATEGRTVHLNKLYAFVTATDELLEDAPRLQNRVTVGAAEAIRWKADDALVNGSGTGMPLGWMNSGGLVTVAKETSQDAETINTQNVVNMYSRMLMSRVNGAFWMIHQSALPQIMTLQIGNQPIWTPPNAGLREAPGGMLMGLPVRFSEHAETLGSKGDIQLVAPGGYYATVKSSGIKFAASMHLYFDYDIEAFRWTFRLGGQPYLRKPVSPAKGANTLSHFITLAERA